MSPRATFRAASVLAASLGVLLGIAFRSAGPESSYAGRSVPEWAAVLRSGSRSERLRAVDALTGAASRSPRALAALVLALRDSDSDVRFVAATALGLLGGQPPAGSSTLRVARPELVKMLRGDPEPGVRAQAARALAAIDRDGTAMGALLDTLTERDLVDRKAAPATLSRREGQR